MMNIDANLAVYLAARTPTDRYASFDYCFNYFQSQFEDDRLPALAEAPGLQMSCLHLGFYLASWGMYRGSTVRLQRSLAYLTHGRRRLGHMRRADAGHRVAPDLALGGQPLEELLERAEALRQGGRPHARLGALDQEGLDVVAPYVGHAPRSPAAAIDHEGIELLDRPWRR
jgi:hypothetical protein